MNEIHRSRVYPGCYPVILEVDAMIRWWFSMRKAVIVFLLAICLLAGGCAPGSGEMSTGPGAGTAAKPLVVATIFPLADLVRQIGGDKVEVAALLPAGASPHTFEPTPKEMKEVSRASLFVSVGAGLDVWGQKLLAAAGTGVPALAVTDGLRLLPLAGRHDRHGEEHEHAGEEGDPHVWLDPVLVRDEIAPRLAGEMSRLWPAWADYFQENLHKLQGELSKLDEEFLSSTAGPEKPRFISFHAAWGYLTRRYGWEEVASVLAYPGQEPSARWLKELTDLAVREGVKTVIIEPQFNPQPAELLAEEIGGRVLILDPIGGEGVEGRDSYLALMRYNLTVMKEALEF